MNKKNNKIALGLALFSTGLAGVLVGALVLNKPNFDSNPSYAASEKMPAVIERTETATSKTDIADKLSKDFITISKDVTPAVVSIYSTKIIKQRPQYHEFYDDPLFRRFFGNPNAPNNNMPDEEESDEQQSKQYGLGSGVLIDKDGIILTNNHVVEGADDINITLSDRRKFKAKVIGTDPKTDVAVIKIENGKNLPIAKLGDSSKISVGEWVLAIGNPLGLTSTVTSGIISAKGRADVGVADFEDFIQTDAAINPGNSGGALVNLQGEVIGINTAIASRTGGYMGIGFAIPSNMAKKVMNDLVTKGKVSRGFLGVQIQPMTESLAKSLNVTDSSMGIVVGDVFKSSPAEKAGIQRYDVILELNGNNVTDVNSFRNSVAATDPGQNVKLTVLRNGKRININIKLGELENAKMAKNPETVNAAPSKKLGFEVEPLTRDLLNQLRLNKNVNGVIVSKVNPNSGAAEAGLLRGDIIQEINKVKIDSDEDYNNVVKNVKSGDSILLKVLRGNANLILAFTYQ